MHEMKHSGAGIVQSVLLKRDYFPTEQNARAWAVAHGYKAHKIDRTPEYYHFRQVEPSYLEHAGYRMRNVPLGKEGYLTMAYHGKKPHTK